MRKLILFLVVAALLVFATKFVLEYQYKQHLDRYLAGIASSVSIAYRDLTINNDLSISVMGVQAQARLGLQPLSIDEVRISSRDPLFIVNGIRSLRSGELVLPLAASLRGLSMDQKLLPWISQQRSCLSFQGLVDYSLLSDEGSFAATVNLRLREVAIGELELEIASLDQLLEIDAVVQLSQTELETLFDTLKVPSAGFIRGSVEVAESAIQPMIAGCAKQLDLRSTDSFQAGVLGRPVFVRNTLGRAANLASISAIKRFLTEGKVLDFKMTPFQVQERIELVPFSWNEVELELLVDSEPLLLGARVINKPVTPALELVTKKQTTQNENSGERTSGTSSTLKPITSTVKQQKEKPHYQEVEIGDLSEHLRKQVKVGRALGKKEVQGKLVAVEESRILILQRINSGNVTLSVAIEDIATVLVRQN